MRVRNTECEKKGYKLIDKGFNWTVMKDGSLVVTTVNSDGEGMYSVLSYKEVEGLVKYLNDCFLEV